MTDDITLRRATDADLAAVAQLVNMSYRGDSSRVGWTTEADLLGGQRTDEQLLAAEDGQLWVAVLTEDPSDLVGCFLTRSDDDGGYIGLLTVRPFHQGAGFGAELLAYAERVLAEAGHDRASMTVIDAREDLIEWYLRHGWTDTEERTPFPMDDARFGIPLVEHLQFAVLTKPLAN